MQKKSSPLITKESAPSAANPAAKPNSKLLEKMRGSEEDRRKTIDLTGQKFSRLTVLDYAGIRICGKDKVPFHMWNCRCDCGNERTIASYSLRSGNTKSCGCFNIDRMKERFTKHGHSTIPEYRIWQGVKDRITNPLNNQYHDYGGRGLIMDSLWLNDFEAFYDHVGPRPSPNHTIERRNNSLGYVQGNVYWATRAEQSVNKRNNVFLTLNGKTQVVAHWAKELGIDKRVISSRLELGWSAVRALTAPLRKVRRRAA